MSALPGFARTLAGAASCTLGGCCEPATTESGAPIAPIVSSTAENRPLPSAPVVERIASGFMCGTAMITTPLPLGYPDPTAPGVIEVKSYPLVRRAKVKGDQGMNRGMDGAFWPLFRHIQRRDIKMTSPVEMNYSGLSGTPGDQPESWSMAFLYREAELGPTGTDRSVVIEDVPPIQVASIGFQGPYRLEVVRVNLARLEAWLAAHPQWERTGEPRALFYNGPEQWEKRKWGEVQVPVRSTGDESGVPS